MNQDMNREILVRKKYIETFVEMLYGRFSDLFSESVEDLKRKAVDRYLYTNLTYDDITKEMISIIEKKKEEKEKKLQEKERERDKEKQLHYDLNELFDCRVSNNTLHIHVVPKSVREDMANAGGPTKYLNDVVAPKLDDALDKVVEILDTDESLKDVSTVAAISPTLRLAQNLFKERGFEVGETNEEKFVRMFGDTRIFMATIPKEKLIELQEKKKNGEVQENQTVTTEPVSVEKPVVKNELNEMFNTPEPVKESNKVQENDIHKQLVKKDTPNTSNKESGVISIFNISLALLIMTGLILIAMILNVVLK
jgi:hypothetical protein